MSRIAVIGMAGRFPGAPDVEAFWQLLAEGREALTVFSEEELRAAGVPPALLADPAYVRSRGLTESPEGFDAAFFGLNPREADIMDPQHRVLLETAWQALERAGYDPRRYPGLVGVFAGAGSNTYLLFNLARNREVVDAVGMYQAMLGSDADFLATRISYKLGLRGPSLTVQTACSTSLVAVHLACQSLLAGECDMALAGGVRISVPQKAGYLYQPGGIFSPDGHCRPFDAAAQGCLDGDGAGMVVLKRLDDALADGDHIHAVILGSAINNDGSSKIGYTAPSAEGQAEVISLAQALAGVEAASIGYVEAHGTATPLGDPIEVSALKQVFADSPPGSCVLGSVKSNFGHLDAAAGIASLIKAALALEHGRIPSTVNFERPNPGLDLEGSPFVVSSRPMDWPTGEEPRRAGVSSFGIGGTNAHVVLEEAPPVEETESVSRPHQLLVLSAATESALEAATVKLVDHLRSHPEEDLADVAYTLQVGRRVLPHRRMSVVSDREDALAALGELDPRRVLTRVEESEDRPVVFLFPGQGAQYPGMAERLYKAEPVFREQIDLCDPTLRSEGIDLLGALYDRGSGAADRLRQTELAQVAIFAVEHALARLWMSWGVMPAAMIGHSVGEYVAACLAGVFTLEEAVRLVAARGRLMQGLAPGAMLSVPLPEAELRPLLSGGLAVAAVNTPALCVASGEREEIEALAARLEARGVNAKLLHTSHAFHSPMMEPVLERFAAVFAGLDPQPPSIPYVSNLTGTWVRPDEAMDPDYWVRHLRRTVRFSEGLETLFARDSVLLEVGPGRGLSSLARQHPGRPGRQAVLSSLPAAPDSGDEDLPVLLRALGQLWLNGVAVDWNGFHASAPRRRLALPTYPFERRRHWVEPKEGPASAPGLAPGRRDDVADWAWVPLWKQALPPKAAAEVEGPWLVLLDGDGFGERLAERLAEKGRRVLATSETDYEAVLDRLGDPPRRIVHLGNIGEAATEGAAFFSLLALVRALGKRALGGPLHVGVVSSGLQGVEGADEPSPLKALLLGVVLTLPQELPGVTSQSLDVRPEAPGSRRERALIDRLITEMEAAPDDSVVAWRGPSRWVRTFEPMRLEAAAGPALRERGTYLITGGSGGVGLEIAGLLARTARARLVLVSRSPADPARVRELEEMGAEVLALAADVSRTEDMRQALAAARERFGPIHGVIHAAGVPGSGVLQLTADEAAAGVLAPKVRGTLVLEELLEGEEIDFLVLCSSLSAVLGGPGQADYAAANAFLDAFAESRSLADRPVISIGWDTWRGVGMAAGPSAKTRPQEPAGEIRRLSHPLLLERSVRDQEEVFLSRFRTGETWVLDEHRLGGHPIVPGTTWLEMAGAAFREAAGNGSAFEMRDVLFVAPLRVGDGESKEVRTVLRRESDAFRFRVASDGQEHALGTILPLHAAPETVDLGGLQSAAHMQTVLGEEYREDLRTAGLGPRWESLRQVWVGDGYALGYLELAPELGSDVERFGLHPALMDIATSFGESYVPKGEGHYLPLSYKRLLAHGPLPRKAWSYVRFGQPSSETLSFDVTVLGEDGRERVRVEEFVLKRVDVAQTMRARSERKAPEAEIESQEGMTPAEAVEVLRRILAGSTLPRIAVSTVPLPQAIENLRSLGRDLAAGKRARIGGAGHSRPDLSTPYVAPRSEAERRVAAIWEEILGVEPVGAFDDFFELGGHSLLGTQLVSRLRAELGVELPLSRLFEAPTLADLAALVEGETGPVQEEPIPIVPRTDDLPLSFAQERLWFLDRLDPGSPFYNVSQALRMEGRLDPGRLDRGLAEIVRRHESLRTAFADVNGRPAQRVLPEARPAMAVVDLSGLGDRREAEVERLAARATGISFDLARPPLFATTLFRLSPEHHVFVLTMHHIVSDGWSIGVLISELAALYRAYGTGEPSPLQPLPVQYADFAHWQRDRLREETVEQQVDYWRRQLAGPLPVLELPTDRPRPAVQTFRGAAEHMALPRELVAGLKTLCHREGATPFMGLLAAFAVILQRWSGQDDLLVGSPISGRNRREVEGLIGVFLNTLVLRLDLSGGPGFRELLGRVRETAVAAYARQDVPIERLLEELRPDRDLSRASLFQVLFNMQDFPRGDLELPGLTLSSLPLREAPSKFDLTVYAAEVEGEILLELVYNADLFDRARIEVLLAQYRWLLAQAVERPDTGIADLSLIAPETRDLVPDPAVPLPKPDVELVGPRFLALALEAPDRPAIVSEGSAWTYGELRDRAVALARTLIEKGLLDAPVAVQGPRSPDLVAALLGVTLAGGAPMPLDPRLPERRQRLMLESAGARCLVRAGGQEADWIREVPGMTVLTPPAEAPPSADLALPVPGPDDPAYVFFTSGTTGVPKGVLGRQAGLAHFLAWQREEFGVGPGDRVAQLTGLSFDVVLRDLFLPLTSGATLCLPEADDLTPERVLPWMERSGITLLHVVPAVASLWLGRVPAGVRLADLRWVFFAGEPLTEELVLRWRASFPGAEIANLYGPTETTLAKCCFRVPSPPPPGVQPVGWPLPQTQALVIAGGASGRRCGLSEAGEIVVRTPFRSLGYLNPSADSGEAPRFRPNPFREDPEDLMYFTGDLGRYRPDGVLEILGRLDDQVKIRGIRVEPAEARSALAGHPAVLDCAVVAREDGAGGKRLVAYVVPRPGESMAGLRGWLSERVPEPLIPAAFVQLDALPLTVNGKLDRGALPEPGRAEAGVEAAGFSSPLEELLATVFCDLLALDRVAREDGFFELGGHSLLATRLVSQVRELCSVEIPLRAVFEEPTVAGLARRIEQEIRGVAPGLRPHPREGRLPLSFAQERFWLLEQLEPGTPHFNLALGVRLRGRLDLPVFRRAIQELVRRHEPLRTTFEAEDGRPHQRIAPALELALPLIDLSGLGDSRAALADAEAAMNSLGFDLQRGPLARAWMLRLGGEEHAFLLVLHHIVGDGWSMRVLTMELARLYAAFLAGEASPLPGLPIQYADFAAWQRSWLTGEVLEEQLAYWRGRLGGELPTLDLPLDRPRPAVQTFRGAETFLILPPRVAAGLRTLGRREGASNFMVLLAAFSLLLHRYDGQDEILVGSPIAGRSRAEVEGLIGIFVNTLVLRMDQGGDPTFAELVRRARQVALEAYAHQDLPFEKLLEEIRPERDLSRTPVFQVFLNMLNLPMAPLRVPSLDFEELLQPEAPARFDLTLYVRELPDTLSFRLVYDAGLFTESRMTELLAQLAQVLEQAVEEPEQRVGGISLLTPGSRAVLPDPEAELSKEWMGAVHERFRENALKHPERLAVVDPQGSATYGELFELSRRVAGYLVNGGIGSEDVVAIYAHRSLPLVAAVLGVLEAGAAFLILDPLYPPARLRQYLEWAGVQGWIAIAAAGEPPAEVREYVEGLPAARRLVLPRGLDGPVLSSEVEVGAESLALVSFTSGSTGLPKGVLGLHGSLSHFLPWHCRTFGLSADDRFTMLSALAHDPLQRDIFTPLWIGAALCIPDPDDIGAPGRLAEWMARERVTVTHLTPAMGKLVSDPGESGGLPSLRRAFYIGEELTRRDVATLRRIAPEVVCVNLYGATETQRALSYHVVDPDGEGREVLPLGRGMEGCQLLVLNAAGQLAGVGEVGEIGVRSPHLARGYLGGGEEDRARFGLNPLTNRPGDRLYRTGDFGRYRPDGEVEFAGRRDHEVKVRGFRVDLSEVEAALASHPAVRETVVLALREPGGTRLAAWVVPADSRRPDAGELRLHLRIRLPEAMVPSAWIWLDRLPLTPAGKLDRETLAATVAPAPETAGEEPRTLVEEILCGIFGEVLGLERVGRDAGFFDLGGHSLLAAQVVSRVRRAFGVSLPLRALFEHPTAAGFAGAVERALGAEGRAEAPPLVSVPRDSPLPLSFSQERFWLLEQLEPGSPNFNLSLRVRLRGRLDLAVFRRAVRELVRRHEPLRTTFEAVDGQPRQRIAPTAGLDLPLVDLSGLGDSRAALADAVAVMNRRGFALARGPLARAWVLRLAEEEHAFVLVLHHIVGDGWSMSVLSTELAQLYAAFSAGEASPLSELPVQYADFAAWQRAWLTGEVLEEHLAYWRERLGGELPTLDLPLDRPRPAVQTFRGAETFLILQPRVAAGLRTLGRREGASSFMVLLAAFSLLLHRYAGQDEVLVGSPIAGRSRAELEGLIGIFVNTLVLRMDQGGDPTFAELVRRARQVALGAYAHQDLPFEKLLEEIRPERDLSRTPVFQVFLNMLNLPGAPIQVAGLDFEELAQPEAPARFDLTLYVRELPDTLAFRLVYDAGLFTEARMTELLAQLAQVLEQAVEEPEQRIGGISLLTPGSRAVLPDAEAELSKEWIGAVHERFRENARKHPDRLAVIDPQGSATYGELFELSRRVAGSLVEGGIASEDVVAIYAHRSLPLVAAVLGVLEAGAAFLILDPLYPPARLRQYLELAGVQGWIAIAAAGEPPAEVREYVYGLPAARRLVLSRGLDGPVLSSEVEVGPESLALVSFTSGSTGLPKGVLGLHGSLSHFLPWHCRTFGLSADDRFTMLSALAHDPLQRDIFTPLWIGAALCIPDPDDIGAPGRLAEWMARERVTVTHLTPAMGKLVSDPGESGGLPSLRRAFYIGEELTRRDVATLRRIAPEVVCVNLYGATETQRALGYHVVDPDGEGREVLPLGRGMEGCQLLVLNAAGRLAGVGEVGEIGVRSPHLARGYLGGGEEDGARFGLNPLTNRPGDRLYRTGDFGRYRPDGEVEFAGRADHEVKVRGFRVDLREVEAALTTHPAVRETVVLASRQSYGARLAAWIVPRDEQRPDLAELRRHLRSRLPEYMVPSAWAWLERLPLTPAGKLDREALSMPMAQEIETQDDEPRTLVEKILAEIFGEVLGLERVGRNAGFFDLGGHSLLAAQVVARVQQAFGISMPLRTLFEHPTGSGLSVVIEQSLGADARSQAPPLVPRPRNEPLPLSFAQERLWFLDQLEPGGAAYNMPQAVLWRGPLDLAALNQALSGVARRHESLRTVLRAEGGEPVQVVLEAIDLSAPVFDLSGLPEEPRRSEERRLRMAEARSPFDLSRGPLLRVRILRLAEDEHVLLLTMHHIVSDGWSMGVLRREIGEMYEAFSQGREPVLPELAVQYADYALWQREWLSGRLLADRLAYWRQRLAGGPGALELPLDFPRPPVPSYRGSRVPVSLPAELPAGLRALARQESATHFMVVLSGLMALLHRWTGQTEIRLGTPTAGRDRVELEPLIGFFVNTLVLRGEVRPEASFADLLGQMRREVLESFAHQDLPFEKLVEELEPERSLSRSPLFQVMLAFQSASRPGGLFAPAELESMESSTGTAKFDLTLAVIDSNDGLSTVLEYASDLFDGTTILRLADHLASLLAQAAASPDEAVGQLSLLSEPERHQVLVEWNDTGSAAPLDRCVHELFAEQARKTPDAVAVVCGDQEIRYRELLSRSASLASCLRSHGVGPDVRVGLLAERSVGMVVGLLGILQAGGAYLPLDPAYPGERLRLILEDAGAPVVLARDAFAERLPDWGGRIVPLDGAIEGAAPVEAQVGPDHLAYVVHTSGSTGVPKGVGVPHKAVVRLVLETGYARFGPEEAFLQLAPLAFDASTFEIWGALLHGGKLVMMPPGAPSLEEIGSALRRYGVTTLWLTAGLFHRMVEERLEDLAGLRQLLAGGEALSVPHVSRFLRELDGARLINGYGPTENTTFTCCCPLDRWEALRRSVPLGRPIAGTRVYVLDPDLRPQPIGVPGEVFAAGVGQARGYLGRPDLTAEKFVPDPVQSLPGARMYRTGDVGRWLADGRVEYLGRSDDQIKIRGFRIEPGEVEVALSRHPRVRAAVVGVRGEGIERRLVAWIVAEAPPPSAAEVRELLSSKLPDHMVPSALVFLDALPLTVNGKVDRRALPDPEPPSQQGDEPRTPVEEILCGIFAEVLGLEQVGRESGFFEMGGHSLLATRVVSRLRQSLGVELPLRALFERPSAVELAVAVEGALGSDAVKSPPLVPVSRDEDLPPSFAQERLCFLDQLEPGSSAYNVPVAVRLSGDFRVPALAATLDEVFRRHESLRTTFPRSRGKVRQRIAPPGPVPLPIVDLGALDQGTRDSEARRLATAEARRPFDLVRGPLLRTRLLRLADSEHVLLLTLHHIVSDGWSMGVLVREVGALYAATCKGLPSPLPDLPIQYADFAQWQRGWLQGEVLQRQLAYWKRQLAGAPPALLLQTDRPRPARPTHRGGSATFTLPESLSGDLRRLSREQGVTLYMLLLAAFGVLLHRDSGQEDLLIGSAIANRNRAETEGLIGFFVNMLVLRLDLGGKPRFRDLLERVRTVALEAYAHQDLPYERLVEEVRPGRDTPLLQVAFGLNNVPLDDMDAPGLTIHPYELDEQAARFDLTVWVAERGGRLLVTWKYAADLFEAATIRRLQGRFESLLASVVSRPEARIHALEITLPTPAGDAGDAPAFPRTRRRSVGPGLRGAGDDKAEI